jgi:Tol biopolymer transport system component
VKTKNNAAQPNDGQSGVYAVDLETARCELIIKNGGRFRASPNRKLLAYQTDPVSRGSEPALPEIWTYDLATHTATRIPDKGKDVFSSTEGGRAANYKPWGPVCWSPDGKQIVAPMCLWDKDRKKPIRRFVRLVNRDGSGAKKMPIPETDEVDDWSPDGKWLVTVSDRDDAPGLGYQLYRMRPDGTEQLRLTKEGRNCSPRFSPDGRRIVYHRDYWMSHRYVFELHVMDVDGSNDHVVLRNEGSANFDDACWSPDGRRLAVIWYTELLENGVKHRMLGEVSKHRIEVMDADGKNRRLVKIEDAMPCYMCCVDWR